MRGLSTQQRLVERLLYGIERASARHGQVSGEVSQERRLGQPSLVTVEDDAGRGGRRGIALRERSVIFAGVWGPGGNVDEGGDVGMEASFRDDHPGKGVAGQYGWAVLTVQCSLRCGDRLREGG